MPNQPKCVVCGQKLAGIDLWINRYAVAVLPFFRERCRPCQEVPVCSRCGTSLEAGERSHCRSCRSEYDANRYARRR